MKLNYNLLNGLALLFGGASATSREKQPLPLQEPEDSILGSKEEDELFMEELVLSEGKVRHVYQDTKGYYTIGIGTLVDERLGAGLTDEEMYYLARNRVRAFSEELDKKLPWWRDLTPRRQRVILELAYNMGVGSRKKGLLSFFNTLPAIERGDYETAVNGLLRSKWADDVGPTRAGRLTKALLEG